MADARKLAFAPFAPPAKGVLIVFCDEGVKFGPATRKLLAPTGDLLQRSAAADRFTGKAGSALDIVAPAGLSVVRVPCRSPTTSASSASIWSAAST